MTLRNGQSLDERSLEILDGPAFRLGILTQVGNGRRLVSLFGRDLPQGGVRLHAVLADDAQGRLGILSVEEQQQVVDWAREASFVPRAGDGPPPSRTPAARKRIEREEA